MSLIPTVSASKVSCKDKKFIFIGCGSVAKATIYHLADIFDFDYNNVYVIDEIDMKNVPCLQEIWAKGATFIKLRIEDEDWELMLKLLKVRPFDVVVDLTTNTNCLKAIEACRKLSVCYMNTSMEINWHFSKDSTCYDESLYKRHVMAEDLLKKVQDPNNATQVWEFGMNPGLISHFTLQALIEISKLVLADHEDKELETLVQNREYAKIAKYLGVEVVHCSEIDTQVAKNVVSDDVFVNTWSCIGLLEEGLEPAQGGWGTHEKKVPQNFESIGQHLFGIKSPAYKKYHRSYVPDQEIIGVVIPHGEGVTITQALSTPDYSPTVHYVYQLCPQTRELLKKIPFEELHHVREWRVMDPYNDNLSGEDRVGALLILNKNPITGEKKNWSYWYGSILGQELSKYFGPTVLQVAGGIMSAIRFMIENPQKGQLYSENLPVEWVIENAKPYLGKVFNAPVPWSPASTQFEDLSVQDA